MEKEFLNSVEEHQGIIYKICKMYRDSKEDQEDLFQEIVLQLWKAYPNFKGTAKMSTWMYRIGLNTALALFRKKRIALDYQERVSENSKTVDSSQEPSENEERLFEAIRKLNPVERAITALYLEDYAHKEIATITGISENYVGVRINRIKNKLKKIVN
ncbi:RNA polymerase sigma factor [Spongiimicrobium salis]|uniref:RNA polymerase sigma factor n=1 Tax=Spongiimicrobium salis TaxID=1667022 RepID=UPI00374D67BB